QDGPGRRAARSARDVGRQDARFPRRRVPERRAAARPARGAAAVRVAELLMPDLLFDIAHLLAGIMVLISFLLLYQRRMSGVINTFAAHASVLALAAAWQAFVQNAPPLYITAAIALGFNAIFIPVALHRIVRTMEIHRAVETVFGVALTMLVGVGLVALSILVFLPVTTASEALARVDLVLALSVVLLGLLMMITRR